MERATWVAVTALSYGLLHHLGAVPGGFGALGVALPAGLTWATNCLGGDGTALPGLLVALARCAYGNRHRTTLAGLLVVGYLPAVFVPAFPG